MKLANLLFGFLIFSIVLSLFFAATGDIMELNKVAGFENFQALSVEYEGLAGQMVDEDSTTRGIVDLTKSGAADSDEKDITILKGAVSGGRLAFNFLTNMEGIVNNATEDVRGDCESYIDRRITNGLIFLILIFLSLALLHFARGFKIET